MEEKATEEKALTKSTVGIDTALRTHGGLIPHNLDQLWRLACMMSKSGMMPTGIQTPEAVAVAVQMGLEVGLSPMSAVQNIAVINGRPSIWGDSVLGLVRASGLLVDFHEDFHGEGDNLTAICTAKRKDQKTEIVRSFSVADAKLAQLWGANVWKKYPKRMLQMRARSWTLRDGFGDVIKGLRVAEEVIDMITTNGTSFELGDAAAALNAKIKEGPKDETKTDIYETKEPDKEEEEKEEEKEEGEDQIRKLYINLRKPGFKEFVASHKDAIPNMEEKYQAEIRSKWQGFYPEEEYPLDVSEEKAPVEDATQNSVNMYGEGMQEKPDPPITLNCPLSYEDRPEKNEEGRVKLNVCDSFSDSKEKPACRNKCVAYSNYQDNITG